MANSHDNKLFQSETFNIYNVICVRNIKRRNIINGVDEDVVFPIFIVQTVLIGLSKREHCFYETVFIAQ